MKRETKAQKIARLENEYSELNKQVEVLMNKRRDVYGALRKLGARPPRNPNLIGSVFPDGGASIFGALAGAYIGAIALNKALREPAKPAPKKAMKAARLKK